MKYINFSITALSLLALTGCSSMSNLWLGDDKKERLVGERITVYPSVFSTSIDEGYKGTLISIPQAQNINEIKSSNGINSVLFPNLSFTANFKKSKEFSFKGSNTFSSITQPILFDNQIIILDPAGMLLAYDLDSNKKLWETAELRKKSSAGLFHISPDFYHGGITLKDNILFVTLGLNTITAINADDGSIIWSKEIASPTRSTPALANDLLFIQTLDNSTYALNAKTGEIVWAHYGVKSDVSTVETSSPVVVSNIVLVQYSSGEIVGIETTTGNELMSLSNNSGLERLGAHKQFHSVVHKIILEESLLIFYDNEGIVSALNLKDGKQLWSNKLGFNKPLWSCGELAIGINESKELIAFNKYDGRIKWQTNLKLFEDQKNKHHTIWSEPIVGNNKILIVNSQGQLFEFDINSGEKLFQREVIKNVMTAPIIFNGKLYLLSNNGKIVEYS
ncbi:hypothetical protein NF27_BK00960 [Candidatus Jidaibacter acanthamoeba]|uniref:Pyrrolo-quinoline quinone repeat domain-containing protein n=2 Tax=Candidatus Jidaibacter acanthamoebae TaxID=86105 RepID=A0A0C1R1L8_9RICK|nr:hypothetical protein NF27_BK00960 [Candidatus Jidaibacter acanthamoeba]